MAIARGVWCVLLFLVGTALFFHFRWSSTSSTHLHLEAVNNACLEKVKNLTDNWKKENGKEALALTTLAKTPNPVDPPPPIPMEDAYYKEDRPQAFHLFWEDVAPVARGCPCRACSHKLAVLIRSWLATQDTARSSLTIWATNTSFLSTDPLLTPLLPFINIRAYKSHEQAQGTVLEGSPVLDYTDERAYLQSDLARILILYRHGGTYVDTDSIFLNDFTPLWDHEFVARWACTPGIAVGVLHFEKGSEFALDLMKAIAATASNPERGGYDWGRELYTRVYAMRQQRAATYPQQQPLPYNYEACYFYPEWCTEGFHDYAMTPDPDEPERPLFLETFTYHWHGAGGMRYNKPIEPGSQFERTSHLVDRALMLKFGNAAVPLITNHGFDPAAPIPWCWPYIWKRMTKYVFIPIGLIITLLAIIHWLKPTFIPRMITIIHTRIITPIMTWCMGKRRIHAYSAVPNRSDV